QIDERTPPGMQSVELSENVGACMRSESSPDLRREDQICAFVISDEQCVERSIARSIAADDELLLFVQLQLHPGAASPAGFVQRRPALGHHSFQPQPADSL